MRLDHRPYWLKKAFLTFRKHYIQYFVAPHLNKLGKHPTILKPSHLLVSGGGITIDDFVTIACEPDQKVRIGTWPSDKHQAKISIGKYCMISPGVRVSAVSDITIGNNCMLANGVYITDSDWHGVYDRTSFDTNFKTVSIADNVWLGDHVTVLKGVTIGRNSVIAAGSMVIKDIPANVIAAGNPATVVKHMDSGQTIKTRESIFEDPDYFKKQEYLDKITLKDNSLLGWIRSLLLMTDKD